MNILRYSFETKDWLILLCIGVIAFILFQERGHWLTRKPGSAAAGLDAYASESQQGAFLRYNPPPGARSMLNSPEQQALANQILGYQRAALAKYPALGMPDSEINIRFNYRYKNLVADRSPRLDDPAWPMQLADECARDSIAHQAGRSTPPPHATSKKTGASPLKLAAPADAPAPSLRIQQPSAAVPQTLVFHPAAADPPSIPSASGPAAAPKSVGALPFVTLDAVNQNSGNSYNYNYNSGWSYDVSFRQSVGIAINVRNMSREPAAVNLRWLFFARRSSNGERFVFGAAGKELDLAPGQNTDVPAASPVVQSREVNDYWWNGTRYLSGSKYEGWLVQLVERGSNRIIKQTGSTSYLEDLAKKTDLSALIENIRHGQTEGIVGR